MAVLAGYGALLSRQADTTDVLIATTVSGRTQGWQLGVLGDFINTLVLRLDLSGDPTWREFLGQTSRIVVGALDHQEYPIMLLNEELSLGFDVARAALPPGIQYDNHMFRVTLPDLRIDLMELPFEISQPNFLMRFVEASGELSGRIQYNTDLYDDATIVGAWSSLLTLFDSALGDPERRVSKL
jgi:non-ribosomal peptide synthetase component F